MKKIGLLGIAVALLMGFSSCQKDAYEAADDIQFELVYHVLNQEWSGGGELIQFQNNDQKAILDIDDILHLYIFRERPQITSYAAQNYKGLKIQEITNYVDKSEEGKNYHITFDRSYQVGDVEHTLYYEVFYDLDRNVYYRPAYDEEGNPKVDANGVPVTEAYYKDAYMVVRNEAGEELSREDRVNVLPEYRAIEKE